MTEYLTWIILIEEVILHVTNAKEWIFGNPTEPRCQAPVNIYEESVISHTEQLLPLSAFIQYLISWSCV